MRMRSEDGCSINVLIFCRERGVSHVFREVFWDCERTDFVEIIGLRTRCRFRMPSCLACRVVSRCCGPCASERSWCGKGPGVISSFEWAGEL